MARILFGVSGDGRGHSSRSKVAAEHLIKQGHQLLLVSSGVGYEHLSLYFHVEKIPCFRIANGKGEVDIPRTVVKNLERFLIKSPMLLKVLNKITREYKPDTVISDFEPFVSSLAVLGGIPLISIDNQHVITHFRLEYPRSWLKEYRIARAFCSCINNAAHHFFITCFFHHLLIEEPNRNVTMVPPILRQEVTEQKTQLKDHVLVYVRTPEQGRAILTIMKQLGTTHFLAYGFQEIESKSRNIEFRQFQDALFLQDLAESEAVVTNGGHSLISEALYLGKPIYSLPTKGDFEQMINAYYLQKMGCGLSDLSPSVEGIRTFLAQIDNFRKSIAKSRNLFDRNELFLESLDRKIEELQPQDKRYKKRTKSG